jgi:tripartite-type tricarboxylate transporter receptor subunit TctC
LKVCQSAANEVVRTTGCPASGAVFNRCWNIGLAAVVAGALPCFAQQSAPGSGAGRYPGKPVRVIVAQAVGGNADSQARLFATKLSESLGRQFIVDNRPGRHIAWTLAAKAPADGYTLLVVLPDLTYAPALFRNLQVDPLKDFEPISLMSRTPYLLVANPALPARSVKELIALARAQPGKLNFGGGISGSGTHLMAVSLFTLAGIQASYVPYKGVAQAVIDMLAGQIDAGFTTGSAVVHVQSGKLRALGISTARRSKLLPEIPTVLEQGVSDFDAVAFHGWAAPAGTPSAIIRKLSAELVRIARSPETASALARDNSEPVGGSPEEFRRFIAAEIPRWRKIVRESRISTDY